MGRTTRRPAAAHAPRPMRPLAQSPPTQHERAVSAHLEQSCGSLAAANAHRDDDILHATAPPLDERMPYETCTRCTVRMADRDGTAIHVQAVIGDAQPIAAINDLHGERFVELPQPNILELHTRTLE